MTVAWLPLRDLRSRPRALALFTVNTGSGSVSRYLIARGGALTLLGSTPVRGGSAVAATDDRLSPDGRYLFVVESRTGAVGKFRIAADLDRLWAAIPAPAAVTVVLESTRNARVPLSAWFRRRGARVILVPPEQSADLREYYFKHTKSDRLDSRMLARLPLLHPDGLHPAEGPGPADALRRAARLPASPL